MRNLPFRSRDRSVTSCVIGGRARKGCADEAGAIGGLAPASVRAAPTSISRAKPTIGSVGSSSMERRFDTISFLSDFGTADEFVGVVKAVVRDLAPHVT